MEMKCLKTENENIKERMELKSKITGADEEILQSEYSLEEEKEVMKTTRGLRN